MSNVRLPMFDCIPCYIGDNKEADAEFEFIQRDELTEPTEPTEQSAINGSIGDKTLNSADCSTVPNSMNTVEGLGSNASDNMAWSGGDGSAGVDTDYIVIPL
jgi:hypothetical protein